MSVKAQQSSKTESPKDFARRIIEGKLGQRLADDDLNEVAQKLSDAIQISHKDHVAA